MLSIRFCVVGFDCEAVGEMPSSTTVEQLETELLQRVWYPFTTKQFDLNELTTTIFIPTCPETIAITPTNREEYRSKTLLDLGCSKVVEINPTSTTSDLNALEMSCVVALHPPRYLEAKAVEVKPEVGEKASPEINETAEPPCLDQLEESWAPYKSNGLSITGPFISQWLECRRQLDELKTDGSDPVQTKCDLAFKLIEMYAEFALAEPELLQLSREQLEMILGSDYLRFSTQMEESRHHAYGEAVIFDAICRWLTANKRGSASAIYEEFMARDSLFHRVRLCLCCGPFEIPMLTEALLKILEPAPEQYRDKFIKTMKTLNSAAYIEDRIPEDATSLTRDYEKCGIFTFAGAQGENAVPGILARFDCCARKPRFPPHHDVFTPYLTSWRSTCFNPRTVARYNAASNGFTVHMAKVIKLDHPPASVNRDAQVDGEEFDEFSFTVEYPNPTSTNDTNIRVGYIEHRAMHRPTSRGYYFQQQNALPSASNYSEGQINYNMDELGLIAPKSVYSVRVGNISRRWWLKRTYPIPSHSGWNYISQLRTTLSSTHRFGFELPKFTKVTVKFPEFPVWTKDQREPTKIDRIRLEF